MLTGTDQKTLEGIIAKDEKVLYAFYNEHKKTLLSFILRTLKDRDDAEEVVQDSFFAFIDALRDFRGQSSLKTFLFSIAKNKTIDKLRKKKLKKFLFSHLPQHFVESLASILMDDGIDQKILARKIETIFASIPNDYSTVLRLKYTEGYKVAEIAEIVKLSFKATESMIFRARKAFLVAYDTYDRQDVSTIKAASRRSILGNS